nr:hypothetical protein [Fodinibius roseus]
MAESRTRLQFKLGSVSYGALLDTGKPGDVSNLSQNGPSAYFSQPWHRHESLSSFIKSSLLFNFLFDPVDMLLQLAELGNQHPSLQLCCRRQLWLEPVAQLIEIPPL